MPPGTLSLMLDPPPDLRSDLRNKAFRYGWPPDAELVPAVLRLGREGGGDRAEADAQLLSVALAAVSAHDTRGPVAVGSAHQATKGEIVFGNGRTASFSIAQKPPAPEPEGPRLRVHQSGFDLVPQATPVVLGHSPWTSVTALRSAARIHRPFPPGAPRPAGPEVALVARQQSQHVRLPPADESKQGTPRRDGGRRSDQQGRRHRLRLVRMPPAAIEGAGTKRQAPKQKATKRRAVEAPEVAVEHNHPWCQDDTIGLWR